MDNQHENLYIFSQIKDLKDLKHFKMAEEYIKSTLKILTPEQKNMLEKQQQGFKTNLGLFVPEKFHHDQMNKKMII